MALRRRRTTTRVFHDQPRRRRLMRRRLLDLLWKELGYRDEIAELRDTFWQPVVERHATVPFQELDYFALAVARQKRGELVVRGAAPGTLPDPDAPPPKRFDLSGPELGAYLDALQRFVVETTRLVRRTEGEKRRPPAWAFDSIHNQVIGTYSPHDPVADWESLFEQGFEARVSIDVEVTSAAARVTYRDGAAPAHVVTLGALPTPYLLPDPDAVAVGPESTIAFSRWDDLEGQLIGIVTKRAIPFMREAAKQAYGAARNPATTAEQEQWDVLPYVANWLYTGKPPIPDEDEDEDEDEDASWEREEQRQRIARHVARHVLGISLPRL